MDKVESIMQYFRQKQILKEISTQENLSGFKLEIILFLGILGLTSDLPSEYTYSTRKKGENLEGVRTFDLANNLCKKHTTTSQEVSSLTKSDYLIMLHYNNCERLINDSRVKEYLLSHKGTQLYHEIFERINSK